MYYWQYFGCFGWSLILYLNFGNFNLFKVLAVTFVIVDGSLWMLPGKCWSSQCTLVHPWTVDCISVTLHLKQFQKTSWRRMRSNRRNSVAPAIHCHGSAAPSPPLSWVQTDISGFQEKKKYQWTFRQSVFLLLSINCYGLKKMVLISLLCFLEHACYSSSVLGNEYSLDSHAGTCKFTMQNLECNIF